MKLALLAFSPISRLACRTKDVLYRHGVLKARKAPLPTISVGNLSFGGTEKTPLAMEIIAHLIRMGHRPAFVSRGYRSSWERHGGILSDGTALLGTWNDGGDEPFMVAKRFPKAGVFVGKDRLASSLKARELGFSVIVLDDAFQHRRLARDLDIVLVNPAEARPLREGIGALRRADIILVRKGGAPSNRERIKASFPRAAVFGYSSAPRDLIDLRTGATVPSEALSGKRIVAFCGIAGPQRFLSLLKELGAGVVEFLAFPDHHPYPPGSLKKISDAFISSRGAGMTVTTEKDAWKLVPPAGSDFDGVPVRYLRIGLELEAGFSERIDSALREAGAAPGRPE